MSTEHQNDHLDRLQWYRSSHSGSGGGDCVEVAVTPQAVHVRDSKDTARRGLSVPRASWDAFAAHLRG